MFTKPHVDAYVKSSKPGKVFALSYCNIHGLWESDEEVK
ncbi:MAG: desulfoferrodoxin family protein [Finegoldia magna]|nr:desulfoferrodoxin family protein [Finegoldia magna]